MAAVVTFGVDVGLLQDRYFPTDISDQFAAVATEIIAEVAADLEPYIRAAKVEPDDLTEAHSPRAYRWLQNAILVGSAAEVGRRLAASDVNAVEQWDTKFENMKRELRNNANVVLGDITARRSKTRTLHAFR